MRRSVVIIGTATVSLWAAATIAWAQLPDRQPADRVAQAVATPTTPTWTAPVVLVDPGVATVDQDAAQAVVAELAADPRGWRTNLDHLVIRIVKPGTGPTDGLGGMIGWAYEDKGYALVTADAWTTVGPEFAALGGTLDDQRAHIVNHEIGHLLGHADHEECSGTGPAPIMRSWSYKVGACSLNVWPNP